MEIAVSRPRPDDARLWALALCISILINGLLLAWFSFQIISSEISRKKIEPKPKAVEQVITILPEMIEAIPEEPAPEPTKPQLARTSPDQESAEPPASRRYIGERNTVATSDRAPDPNAPAMPSQEGRAPEEFQQPETTTSEYQDGIIKNESVVAPPDQPAPFSEPTPFESTPQEIAKGTTEPDTGEDELSQTAIRETILGSPFPVEIPVPKAEVKEDIKPREEQKTREGERDALAEKPSEKPKETVRPRPQPIDDPAFRGNQSKTAIRGSISRTGRSSLDVADSPMGRYQAKISRAVELEWQRNCARYRDFITPGYITVRFYVQADGSVKSLQSVGDTQTGEIQKGFTLNAIRKAEIPAMPSAVKKEMAGDALELIFNFYF
ncbi:MAG: hypothetical protein AB8D78_08190 [Akkermansiaceae bacterium]